MPGVMWCFVDEDNGESYAGEPKEPARLANQGALGLARRSACVKPRQSQQRPVRDEPRTI